LRSYARDMADSCSEKFEVDFPSAVTVLSVLDGARVQRHQTVAAPVQTVRVAVPYERLRQ
jgi:hypothetical protein